MINKYYLLENIERPVSLFEEYRPRTDVKLELEDDIRNMNPYVLLEYVGSPESESNEYIPFRTAKSDLEFKTK